MTRIRARWGIAISSALAVAAASFIFRHSAGQIRPEETTPQSPAGNHLGRKFTAPRQRLPAVESGAESIADERLQQWLHEAGADPRRTLAKALALTDETERKRVLEWILAAWTSEDRAPALAWMKETLPNMAEAPAAETLELLVGAWALEAPLEAIRWVGTNLSDPWREPALKDIAASWAQADPDAMGAWIESQSALPTFWTEELIQGLIPANPAAAMDWCARLDDPEAAEETRQNVIQSWLLSSPSDAKAYLRDHPGLIPETQPEQAPSPSEQFR
jgi:hypothetical protein